VRAYLGKEAPTPPPAFKSKARAVYDLRSLNTHLVGLPMRYLRLPEVLARLHPGCLLTALDIADGFKAVPMAARSRPLLGLADREGPPQCRFICMPLGLSVAPFCLQFPHGGADAGRYGSGSPQRFGLSGIRVLH
jgi:hypothetical protein